MTYHTKQSHNSKKAHCRITSCRPPDAHSFVVCPGVTGDSTLLQWDVSPVMKALYAKYAKQNRTIYNAENRYSALPGFLVNAIKDLLVEQIFNIQAVPSSVMQKMCNRRSAFLAKEFGIDDFSLIFKNKDRVG